MGADHTPRVLVVVDRSPGTQYAVIAAAAVVRDRDTEVIVCRARTLRPSRAGPIESESKEEAQRIVDEAAAALERLGAQVVDRLVVTSFGMPAESIVQAAFEGAVSMIVIAHSNRHNLRLLLAGRSVHRLLTVSEIPVLVVGYARARRRRVRQRGQMRPRTVSQLQS